jgi:aromatic-L-amino-acid decarboxylase
MDGDRLKALNIEIMLRLQEEGVASLSDTTVHGEHCLRVAINNHRTRRDDLDLLVRKIICLGHSIASEGRGALILG